MKWLISFFIGCCSLVAAAQEGDRIVDPGIRSVKLFKAGDQTSFPVLMLGSNDVLELHFDDLDGDIKNYYYAFQLCNADWTPAQLTTFEYTKGFQNVRITNYRTSSIATTKYTHYQATVPDRNSYPSRSGNYLLKVFINGDTSKLAFAKRFVVVENKSVIGAQLLQPYNSQYTNTHQKLQMGVTPDRRISLLSPQDLKVVVLQNKNWQTSLWLNKPTLYRGNYCEYNDEAMTSMPAGKEWRWIDLRSLRLMSDRMQHIDNKGDTTHVFVKPESTRTGQVYIYYRDLNGSYTMETLENVNPLWQGDYGYVHFTYFPPNNRPFEGQDVYLFGELTNYAQDTSARMQFNAERGAYEKTLFLKQGYYNYTYMTQPQNRRAVPDFSTTEGNNYATENQYVILVYYRPFGGRADELIGFSMVSSIFHR